MKKDKIDNTGQILINDPNYESWILTNQLRWVERTEYMTRDYGDYTETVGAKNYKVLQQMWQGSNGTQKWEDVSTETE